MKINEALSQILDMSIQEGKYVNYALLLDRSGRPDRKEMAKIIFALCQAVEDLQNASASMPQPLPQPLPELSPEPVLEAPSQEERAHKYEEEVKNAGTPKRAK